jgi:hypothetical protein
MFTYIGIDEESGGGQVLPSQNDSLLAQTLLTVLSQGTYIYICICIRLRVHVYTLIYICIHINVYITFSK